MTGEADLRGTGVPDRFEEIAARQGDSIAVVCGGTSLTYRDLQAQVADRGAALAAADGGVRTPVALEMECTAGAIAAVMAVFRSGRPLILLDQQLPEERRAQIVARTGATRLTSRAVSELAAGTDSWAAASGENDCAVLLFTSGSTGEPKGVRHSHRLWLNQASELAEVLGLRAGDRMAAILPMSFGGGLDMLVTALLCGAELHVTDPRVVRYRCVAGVARGHPADLLARHTVSAPRRNGGVCGRGADGICDWSPRAVKRCTAARSAQLRHMLQPAATYCNLSGSSETGNLAFNMISAGDEIPSGNLPAGRVSDRKTVHLLDEAGRPVPAGEIGSIVVESAYIASGYHCDAAGVVLGDPKAFGVTDAGVPVFRMGDLGRFGPDGELHLVGRRDDAVKIRGYLVEPAEVTSALLNLPGIDDAVTMGVRPGGTTMLVAFAAVGPNGPDATIIRNELRTTLPDWMVPTRVVVLPALPRNERGKIDRHALAGSVTRPTYEEPLSATETALAGLWAEILGLEAVGRDDDFIALGGDSLQVQQLLAQVTVTFGAALSTTDLMLQPTIRALAAHIDNTGRRRSLASSGVMVPLQIGGGRQPVFMFSGAGSPAMSMAPLARALGADRPVYGLRPTVWSNVASLTGPSLGLPAVASGRSGRSRSPAPTSLSDTRWAD